MSAKLLDEFLRCAPVSSNSCLPAVRLFRTFVFRSQTSSDHPTRSGESKVRALCAKNDTKLIQSQGDICLCACAASCNSGATDYATCHGSLWQVSVQLLR